MTIRYNDVLLPAKKSVPPIYSTSLGRMYRASDLAHKVKADLELYPGAPEFTPPTGNYCNLTAMEKAVKEAY